MLIDEELTLKKLEVFLAFMRSGNLARAASELQTSNVSVHRAIHSLESALRCPLFKHEGRNLIPLESAYVLEEKAQKLIQDAQEMVRLTREAAGFGGKHRAAVDLPIEITGGVWPRRCTARSSPRTRQLPSNIPECAPVHKTGLVPAPPIRKNAAPLR